ncbi:MAG: hypothetical protein Q8M16_11805 [Pirellulaceae bacterium]|nr:hypothetical protein [Pirellulaceae bacterium]
MRRGSTNDRHANFWRVSARVHALAVGWLFLICQWPSIAPTHAQVTVAPASLSPNVTSVMDESEAIKIRRLFVPEDHLIEFMRGRPTYLPLSSGKFQEMLSGIRPGQSTALTAQPIRHWILTSPGGSVQGYSLVRRRPLTESDSDPSSQAGAWLSFDEWKIPADYFNLVPSSPPPFDSADGSLNSLGRLLIPGNFTEVPVTMSVNEQGLFGLPLVEAEAYMLVRYNMTLATQAEANLYRQLRLPNTPSTITSIRNPANASQPFQINGTMLRVSRPLSQAEAVDSQSYEFFQAISDAPQLIGRFNNVERSTGRSTIQGRYVEHSTVVIRPAVIQYETLIALDFREAVRGDLSFEVPLGLNLTTCEVNGQTQTLMMSPESQGVRELKLPWQSWGTSNQVRLTGTMSPSINGRVSVPRIALPGHTWILGNVQVRVEPPLQLRDYELINSRVVHCQELGQAQNLSFHWGGPESHVTLLVDTATARTTPMRPKSLDVVLLTAEQESLEADQYMLLDNRFRDSNVLELKVADSWQVEQVAVVDLRQLPEASADRVTEASTTPLQWTPGLQGDGQTILVALPIDPKDGSLAVRVRAVRPANQWPIDIDCQIVPGPSQSNEPPRPCLVGLRGTAGIQAGGTDPTAWEVLTNDEARQLAVELRGVVGAGSFRYSANPARLTLQNNAALTGSYDVLAYTRNQLLETGTVQQWHRLLIQPSGPVYEVEIASSGPTQLAGRWSVQDKQGQPIPFEVGPAGPSDTYRIRFPKPLSDSVSILVEQEWVPEPDGVVVLYFAPKARSFAGVIDSRVPASTVFRIETKTTDLADRSRLLSDFCAASRRWYQSELAMRSVAGIASTKGAAPPTTNGDLELGDTSRFESLSVYEHPRDVRFNQGSVRVVWGSAMVTNATQIDTWQQDAWSTRLLMQVFSETAETLTVELPLGTSLALLQVDETIVVPNHTSNKIELPLSGNGSQSIEIIWRAPHRSSVAMGSGLTSLPDRCDWLQATKFSQRFVCLPNGFSLTTTPDESALVQVAVSRRLLSPLVWSVGWSTLSETEVSEALGWSRSSNPLDRDSEPYRWWRQEVPLDATTPIMSDQVWVVDQRLFEANQWAILLVGCLFAIGLGWLRDRLWSDPRFAVRWWIGGGCLTGALLVPWPFYLVASTLFLGFLIGCSWRDLWRALTNQESRDVIRAADTSSAQVSRSSRGLRALPSSLWFWGLWSGLYTTLWVLQDANATSVADTRHGLESEVVTPLQDASPPQDEPNNSSREPYYSVVIPLEGEQKPSDKVVYLPPELYRRLTNLAASASSMNDLEIRNSQHTLEYDSQLQRFSRLTTQSTCKTQAEKMYLLPANAKVDHVVRQVRVNGVPVLFQRRGDQIEVALGAGTSLLSVSYDLQSIGKTLELSTMGASDSYVVLNGVPDGWQAMVTDKQHPTVRFRSPFQRRFRVDRIKQLIIEVQREATDWPVASVETWLDIQPQHVQCELRVTAGPWAKAQPEWLFQVDSRMTLPPGFKPDAETWTIERLPDAEKPLEAKAGPVYRLRFDAKHAIDQMIRIPWEYTGRSFGGVIPPQVEFLQLDHLRLRKWLVLRVGKGLVYRPADLSPTNYRRGSAFELPGVAERGDNRGRETIPTAPASGEFALRIGENLLPMATDTFVYEELANLAEPIQSVVGRLSLQPTQVAGSLRQDIEVNERSATILISGEIQVTDGELNQFPIRLPLGARIQRLAITTAAQNEVAWTVKQPSATHDQMVVLLRTPIKGPFRFDLAAEIVLPPTSVARLPWVRLPTPLDLSQTLQVRDLTGSWQLRSPDPVAETSSDQSLVEPRILVVSSDAADALDGIELIRQQSPPRVLGSEPLPELLPSRADSGAPTASASDESVGTPQQAENNRTEPSGSEVEVLASRLIVTRLEPSRNSADRAVADQRQLQAVQQLLLRNRHHNSVTLTVPAGVLVQRGWVDQRPADVWKSAKSQGLMPALSAETQADGPRRESGTESGTDNSVGLALDPLEEYSLVTLQLSWQFGAGATELGLVQVAAVGPVPVHLEVADGLEWPMKLQADLVTTTGGAVNIREVFGRKIANWSAEKWASRLPLDHPLMAIAQKPWPESVTRTAALGQVKLAPMVESESAGSKFVFRWDWALVLSGIAITWLLGVIWPQRLPAPSVWGDFGWLVVALGVWLGGGQVWLALLLGTLAASFLLQRLLRSGFSFRFA